MTTIAPRPDVYAQPVALNNPHLSLGGVIRSEWIKAMSLRSIRWTLAVSIVLGVGMSTIMSFAMRSFVDPAEVGVDYRSYLLDVTGFPAMFLALIFCVLGVFVFSSEYSSGMILSTLTATPRRPLVMAAKSIVLTAISAVTALILVILGTLIAMIIIPDSAADVLSSQVLSGFAGTIIFLIGIALMSFAVAGLVRSTAGALTIMVVLLLLAPTILQIMGNIVDWSWVMTVQEYLPMALRSSLGYGIPETATPGLMGYWQAMLALAVWVGVPMSVAGWWFYRRDAK